MATHTTVTPSSLPSLSPVVQTPSTDESARRSANYHPTVWGDHFLSYADSENDEREYMMHEQLKHEVVRILESPTATLHQQLEIIDAIKRLGVAYQFESRIEASLKLIMSEGIVDEDGEDLHIVALRFRLLRQHGHNVASDVFKKFTNKDGKFEDSLRNDVEGIISLYEAVHLKIHGEDILEEALEFTTTQLMSMKSMNLMSNNSLAKKINSSLNTPIQLTMTRLGSREFISIYQEDESHNELLLKFAILDFNILQKMHQRELSEITRWWKTWDIANKLPFTRDRVVECYFWILGVFHEPQYSGARKILAKIISLASTMDDIYDIFGTPHELKILTDAIDRWDTSTAFFELPSCMQLFFHALQDVYAQLNEELLDKQLDKQYCFGYAKFGIQKLAKAYFREAVWLSNGYIPNYDEYMENALISGGYLMLILNTFACMGNIISQEAFNWALSDPLIIKATMIICRLTDDIMTYEIEQERGELVSAVFCYMNQYGVSQEEAVSHLRNQISNAWKDINQDFLYQTNNVPRPLLMVILNFSRMINLLYHDEDSFSNSKKLKTSVASLLVDRVTLAGE